MQTSLILAIAALTGHIEAASLKAMVQSKAQNWGCSPYGGYGQGIVQSQSWGSQQGCYPYGGFSGYGCGFPSWGGYGGYGCGPSFGCGPSYGGCAPWGGYGGCGYGNFGNNYNYYPILDRNYQDNRLNLNQGLYNNQNVCIGPQI
jgi:hypothetical protein